MVKQYRKKPVVIEALEWTGENAVELSNFAGNGERPLTYHHTPNGIIPAIQTLEGTHTVSKGDFVIKGIKGEFYPCKPDIFAVTYEEVK